MVFVAVAGAFVGDLVGTGVLEGVKVFDGMGVLDGIGVLEGVSVLEGVNVIVGVRVIVAVGVTVGVGCTNVVLTAQSPNTGKEKVSQTLKFPANVGAPFGLKRAPQMVFASCASGEGAPAGLDQLIVGWALSYQLPLGS